ncbi:MAG: hypothetical protein EOO01_07190 [Chitinophagaceae bacterium]|nr:MAG: hypothetical protein EOO01_07190 [Chitinophagaceae bacterium]
MNTLFPVEANFPPGFSYANDFISEEEEVQLLHAIDKVDLHNMKFHGYEAKRKTASFGFDYSFENKALTKGKDIPRDFIWLLERVAKFINKSPEEIGELLITKYPEGSVINWHRDAPPFHIIIGISLLADCTFKFRPYDKVKRGRKLIRLFNVARRSIYVMQEEARREWEHCISPVKKLRYSITMRTLKTEQKNSGKF